MTLELVAAVLLGALVLWLVLGPLLSGSPTSNEADLAVLDRIAPAEETRRGQALLAIKDLDFDLATGKLSEMDHAELRERFVAEALEVMREDRPDEPVDEAERLVAERIGALTAPDSTGPTCPRCGPRPELEAAFCSSCGGRLPGGDSRCAGCGAPSAPGARFCGECGAPVGAGAR